MANLAEKDMPKRQAENESKFGSASFLVHRIVTDSPSPDLANDAQALRVAAGDEPLPAAAGTMSCDRSCLICPAFNLLCGGAKNGDPGAERKAGEMPLATSLHSIPARRLILHPKEWSEFVPIICSGWAMSSIALPDGRRQIISFLLPGDIVSVGSLLSPISGQSVEAITEVTYRKFKRAEIKELLFGRFDLLEKLFSLWNEAKTRSDQLALDLGRRRADERIARLILRLSEKVAKRSLVRSQTFDFPLRQRHIADATGLTPVHVSKILGELQRAGLIEINSRSLTILNSPELQRVADWQ